MLLVLCNRKKVPTYSEEQEIHFSSHSYAVSHGVSWMLLTELSKTKASLDQADESSENQKRVKIGYLESKVLENESCYCRSRHSWILWFCTELPISMLKVSLSPQNWTENFIFLRVHQAEHWWYQKGLPKTMKFCEIISQERVV